MRAIILLLGRIATSTLVVELALCGQAGAPGMALEKGWIALEDRGHQRLCLRASTPDVSTLSLVPPGMRVS
jgi:hypothetical protein